MTESLHFEITINAPVETVWDKMLEQESYKTWTAAFEPTSYYEGSWEEGSKIKFLASDGSGMTSQIVKNVPERFISIEHLGEIHGGIEDTTSASVKQWTPAFENYTFTEQGNQTLLTIDLTMPASPASQAMKEMFETMWPKALNILRELCEERQV
ncbi:MAG: hypothetical protein CEO22_581 [Candidatus Berkelbacteria bacterium Gr01-1014_85]|uniref:Activator of Hsp90 ATPase homologue 1/2-like C-terminal domain-containing protein n=1 Tax=Candidatus Berkelbacteria bacterium Gr01-1014_85 TaxID=2017150 RepID=A0A554JA39_9BACT|nr:MAG: hypothetical protein CEO22_581 [Candidatus Berkelbacteria bacterium Gr01-1014_85]